MTQRDLDPRVNARTHTYCVSFSVCADAPLSAEGHRITEAFEGAAAELQGSDFKLAVIDVTKEKDLVKELNATGLPSIRLYLSGDKDNPVDCPGMCN